MRLQRQDGHGLWIHVRLALLLRRRLATTKTQHCLNLRLWVHLVVAVVGTIRASAEAQRVRRRVPRPWEHWLKACGQASAPQ